MCGFTGYALASSGAEIDSARLVTMTRTIEHRGPDDEGFLERSPFALGFRRLSIIDLAGGHQPIESADGRLAVMGNGEIYNYRELRARLEAKGYRFRTGSDIETILHLYLERGMEFVHELVGMYAFCIADWRDSDNPRLVIGRDRLGIKPMYWADTKDGDLYFGSEAKTILASGAFRREMRAEALADYLVQGYIGGRESAWAGIHRLPPGSVLTWTPGSGARVDRYWDLPSSGLRGPASTDEVLELLDEVVSDRLMADVPLGAFLSGGIDSSAVADSMAAASSDPIVLCSVGFEEKSHDELEIARTTAARLGAIHHTEILQPDPRLAVDVLPWFYDEPHADPSTVPTYLVSKMAREHVTVALSGDGGDEIFAGYRRYVHDVAENRLRGVVGAPGRKLAGVGGRLYPKLDWAPRFLRAKTFLENVARDPARAYWISVSQLTRHEAWALLAPDVVRELGGYDPFDAFHEHYAAPRVDSPLFRAQYGDFHTNLPDRILAKVDRASMAVSLEARVPLLDHRFVERFVHLPDDEKVRAARGKHRLRESLRGRLPAQVLDGQKRGFDTPLKAWIRGPLAGEVQDAIESLPADWMNKTVLRTRLEEHRSGRRDHGRLLWSLLVLEHWRRRHGVTGLAGVGAA